MFNKLLWIFGPLALCYGMYLSISDNTKRTRLTEEFIVITQDVCLPVMSLKGEVNTSRFRNKVEGIIPDGYRFKDDEIKTRDGNVCAPYRIMKDGSAVRVSICQDEVKKLRCGMGLRTQPRSLKESKYISSIELFSDWETIRPNRNRPKGEANTFFSRYLCNKINAEGTVNSVTILQNSSLGNVGVTLHEDSCSSLAD